MAKFTKLDPRENYDIVDADTGLYLTQGISGCDAQRGIADWPAGAMAFVTTGCGDELDDDLDDEPVDEPVDIAE